MFELRVTIEVNILMTRSRMAKIDINQGNNEFIFLFSFLSTYFSPHLYLCIIIIVKCLGFSQYYLEN